MVKEVTPNIYLTRFDILGVSPCSMINLFLSYHSAYIFIIFPSIWSIYCDSSIHSFNWLWFRKTIRLFQFQNSTLASFKVVPQTFIEKEPIDVNRWPMVPDSKDIELAENAVAYPVSWLGPWQMVHTRSNYFERTQVVWQHIITAISTT